MFKIHNTPNILATALTNRTETWQLCVFLSFTQHVSWPTDLFGREEQQQTTIKTVVFFFFSSIMYAQKLLCAWNWVTHDYVSTVDEGSATYSLQEPVRASPTLHTDYSAHTRTGKRQTYTSARTCLCADNTECQVLTIGSNCNLRGAQAPNHDQPWT